VRIVARSSIHDTLPAPAPLLPLPQCATQWRRVAPLDEDDPIPEPACPNCSTIVGYLGHFDGGTPDGIRFNVLLWECGNCGGRYSATTDFADWDALQRVTSEPWPDDTYWPG
jgi:hypothetical protein